MGDATLLEERVATSTRPTTRSSSHGEVQKVFFPFFFLFFFFLLFIILLTSFDTNAGNDIPDFATERTAVVFYVCIPRTLLV